MATNFTNKYMQVFQNYNEFGEHSADYVRGEDHIAFLIEENEVIYWLYLEQVWRPLNVRTTTTGELEDGRTKVAVRLEYIEGGQKYTSVPNIPDPERITSMSHFLEDYPDIEEVNVSGTVNLTDLSYAFAGSKIKDVSMLDTSNVTNVNRFIYNINNPETNLVFNFNSDKVNDFTIHDIILNGLTINNLIDDVTELKEIEITEYISRSIIINNLTINGFNVNINYVRAVIQIDDLICNKNVIISSSSEFNGIAKIKYIKCDNIDITPYTIDKSITPIIDCNTAIVYVSYHNFNSTLILSNIINFNTCNKISLRITQSDIVNVKFGKGIIYPENCIVDIHEDSNPEYIIGNFWFITPLVNDDFYSNKNIKISIFQYKVNLKEVADVFIANGTNNKLYVDFSSIDFDTSNISIEIHDRLDLAITKDINFKKFIVDNTNIVQENVKNYPTLNISANINTIENSYISGYYNASYDYSDNIYHNKLYKNITLYCATYVIDDLTDVDDIINIFASDKNIKLLKSNGDDYRYEVAIRYEDNAAYSNVYIDDLIDNGIINYTIIGMFISDNNITFSLDLKNKNYNSINTININECNSTSRPSCIWYFRKIIENSDNIITFNIYDKDVYYGLDNSNYEIIEANKTINMIFGNNISYTDAYLKNIYFINTNNEWYSGVQCVKIITGKVNVELQDYSTKTNVILNNEIYGTTHIDISNVKAKTTCSIIQFIGCDNETNINLITKLIYNRSSPIKTIYMYRSQANIIGEENIAAAVAKNYEFAIIEN